MIGSEFEAMRCGQCVDLGRVADAAMRRGGAQGLVDAALLALAMDLRPVWAIREGLNKSAPPRARSAISRRARWN
jgi:hypothetical protein